MHDVQFADPRYQARVCPACSNPVTGHYRKIYCSRECQRSFTRHVSRNRARAAKRAAYVQEFVGVDGEGVNLPDGSHRYVMFSCGDETLWKGGEELTYRDIFPFLYDCFLNNDRRLAYVGFYLGYDFTHWVKDLSEHEARMLFSTEGIAKRRRETSPMPFPVYIPGWEIDMLGLKRLRFRPHVHNSKRDRCACGYQASNLPSKNESDWMVICDVGSFFQTAFVNVLNPDGWHGEAPCTADEYRLIVEGKSRRSNSVTLEDLSWLEPMIEYNRLENRLLANVMRIYNEGFSTMGVRLNRTQFFGPGQAAQQWLSARAKEGKFITHDDIESVTPIHILDYWRRAYYGGRFEIFYHGIVPGQSVEYDIQSAYPDAIRQLPCLCGTVWKESPTKPRLTDRQVPLTLVHGTFTANTIFIGPLPHRTEKGSIIYPMVTRGWYLLSEVQAAYEAGLIGTLEIDTYVYPSHMCGHEPPLAALADLFAERLRVGKATPHGKALKLVYNSIYGKFAQSIGAPRFGNPIYASLITSNCRVRILQSIGQCENPDEDLVMIATDGVYFMNPIPGFPTVDTNVEALGEWECVTKTNLTLFKPGVYWDDKARRAIDAGQSARLKSRGISGAALQEHIHGIDQAFRDITAGRRHTVPEIVIRTPFSIVSPRLALARGKWNTCAHVSYETERIDRAAIKPKRAIPRPVGDGLMKSVIPKDNPIDSHPYTRQFGYDLDGEELLDDAMLTPDGPAIETVQVAFNEIMH